jgi:hypothetical protein
MICRSQRQLQAGVAEQPMLMLPITTVGCYASSHGIGIKRVILRPGRKIPRIPARSQNTDGAGVCQVRAIADAAEH